MTSPISCDGNALVTGRVSEPNSCGDEITSRPTCCVVIIKLRQPDGRQKSSAACAVLHWEMLRVPGQRLRITLHVYYGSAVALTLYLLLLEILYYMMRACFVWSAGQVSAQSVRGLAWVEIRSSGLMPNGRRGRCAAAAKFDRFVFVLEGGLRGRLAVPDEAERPDRVKVGHIERGCWEEDKEVRSELEDHDAGLCQRPAVEFIEGPILAEGEEEDVDGLSSDGHSETQREEECTHADCVGCVAPASYPDPRGADRDGGGDQPEDTGRQVADGDVVAREDVEQAEHEGDGEQEVSRDGPRESLGFGHVEQVEAEPVPVEDELGAGLREAEDRAGHEDVGDG